MGAVFKAKPWAEAFLSLAGEYPDAALEILRAYCRCALSLSGYLSGKNDADRLGVKITASMVKTGAAADGAEERCRRFLMLMIRKNCFRHHGLITAEIEKLINESTGLVPVILESAFPPGEELTGLVRKTILAQAGKAGRKPVRELAVKTRVNPELIGGLRLQIGNILFDASIKAQLERMAADLGG
jgi:F0F1-type ATP synthase delta subunit